MRNTVLRSILIIILELLAFGLILFGCVQIFPDKKPGEPAKQEQYSDTEDFDAIEEETKKEEADKKANENDEDAESADSESENVIGGADTATDVQVEESAQ